MRLGDLGRCLRARVGATLDRHSVVVRQLLAQCPAPGGGTKTAPVSTSLRDGGGRDPPLTGAAALVRVQDAVAADEVRAG